MTIGYGTQAKGLYDILDGALEHGNLLALRNVLREFIELAAANLREEPENLAAVYMLADTLDKVGTIRAIRDIDKTDSPLQMSEEALLDLLRELPINLIMVAPRKLQAVAHMAQRRFDKAVSLGDDAGFAIGLALRVQMGPQPRRIQDIMAAVAGATESALKHALELIAADSTSREVENWERNLRVWFGTLAEPAVLSVVYKKVSTGTPRMVEPLARAYARLLELRDILGAMSLTPEPERGALAKAVAGDNTELTHMGLGEQAVSSGTLATHPFAHCLMDTFQMVCGPNGENYNVSLPAAYNLVVAPTTSATGELGELALWRLDRDEYVRLKS